MRSASLRIRAAAVATAVAVALVLVPAIASAPTDQYATFNRTDLTITDVNTGLVWQREVALKANNQAEAVSYCQNVYKQDGQQWRLPTMKELLTIVDETPHFEFEGIVNKAKMIDVNAFPRTPIDFDYWSSSTSAVPATSDGWVVRFQNGENATLGQNLPGYVRCVRP
jgi:hypothetical protein